MSNEKINIDLFINESHKYVKDHIQKLKNRLSEKSAEIKRLKDIIINRRPVIIEGNRIETLPEKDTVG